jgi:ligand-binding sensor domain-containing protein
LCVSLVLTKSKGQCQVMFENYTIEQGLSQNSVYSIVQTNDGILWLGTHYGLNSYDGVRFKMHRPYTNDNVHRSPVIKSICKFSERHLLVGTEKELLLFDVMLGKFQPAERILEGLRLPYKVNISRLLIDNIGNIWILTENQGLYQYNFKVKKSLQHFNDHNRLDIKSVSTSNGSGTIVLTSSEIFIFQENRFHLLSLEYPNKNPTRKYTTHTTSGDTALIVDSKNYIHLIKINKYNKKLKILQSLKTISKSNYTSILLSKNNEIWLGTRDNGVHLIDLNKAYINNTDQHFHKNYLTSNFILSIFEDQKKNIWLGQSGSGLSKKLRTNGQFNLIKSTEINSDHMIFNVMQSQNGNLYMGTLTGGLLEFNPRRNSYIYHYNPKLPLETRNIYDIEEDKKGTLWLATWGGLCSFNPKDGNTKLYTSNEAISTQKLYSCHIYKDQIIVSGEYGLARYNMTSKKWSTLNDQHNYLDKNELVVKHMASLDARKIGLATSTKNFVVYDVIEGSFHEFKDLQSISGSVRHFYQVNDNVYLATDNGLTEFDIKQTKILKVWDKNSGLSDDFIYSTLVDSIGNIWCAHNRGLSKISPSISKIFNYTRFDGLQDYEYNTASCYKSKTGLLYFGGVNGVNQVQSKNLQPDLSNHTPIITDIKINNIALQSDTTYSYKSKLNLDHTQNSISFQFISPNNLQNQELKYQYMLVGVDHEWKDANPNNFVNFTMLNPGKYEFKCRSILNEKSIMLSKPLHIHIITPIWLSKTLHYSIIILLALALYLYSINLKRKSKTNFENRLKMANLELETLLSNMNSHFIFNNLNNIIQMIIFNENSSAVKYLSKFATILRTRIEKSKLILSSLQEELETVNQYVEMEKTRIIDLKSELYIENGLNAKLIKVPPFIIEPLVEEIIWESLSHLKEPKVVIVKVYKLKDKVICELTSNGFIERGQSEAYGKDREFKRQISERVRLFNYKYKTSFELSIESIEIGNNRNNTIIKLLI